MKSLFKKFTTAVSNLVQPRTPVEELTHHWTELQAVNERIVELQKRMTDHANRSKNSEASLRLRDGSVFSETSLWDQVKEHLSGILECLTAEQDLETTAGPRHRGALAFSPHHKSAGESVRKTPSLFQSFNDTLVDAESAVRGGSSDHYVSDEHGAPPRQRSQSSYRIAVIGEHGPCLEYFLQHKIMETICVMGLSNYPRGMMSLCLETAYLVLKNVNQPLLPHHSVTTPVCQLIYVSFENLTNEAKPRSILSPTRQSVQSHSQVQIGQSKCKGVQELHQEASLNLMSLVALLWRKIWRNPSHLHFFTFAPSSPHAALLLVPLNAVQLSDDEGVGEQARGCVTTILMLKNHRLENFVASKTHFCENIAVSLAAAFDAECSTRTRNRGTVATTPLPDGQAQHHNGQPCSASGLPLLSLHAQAAFVDGLLRIACFGHAGPAMLADAASCVVSSAEPPPESPSKVRPHPPPPPSWSPQLNTNGVLGDGERGLDRRDNESSTRQCYLLRKLVQTVCQTFLHRVKQQMLQTSEAAACDATHTLGAMVAWLSMDSLDVGGFYPSPLLSLIGYGVLGAPPIAPIREAVLSQQSSEPLATEPLLLRRTLLNRIDSVSEQLSIATIGLMLSFLESGSELVHLAFLPNHYTWDVPAEQDMAETTNHACGKRENTSRSQFQCRSQSQSTSTFQSVASFFGLFKGDFTAWPTSWGAAPATAAATTAAVALVRRRRAFLSYLADAQAKMSVSVLSRAAACHESAHVALHGQSDGGSPSASMKAQEWHALLVPEDDSRNFMRTLLRKIERLLTQTVGENVALTAVFSTLAVASDNVELHNKLFTPLMASDATDWVSQDGDPEDRRGLVDVLVEIWDEAQRRLAVMEESKEKLEWVRSVLGVQELLGTESEAMASPRAREVNNTLADQFETTVGEERFLRAYVVLEEFITELAAIQQAKRLLHGTKHQGSSISSLSYS